MEMRAWCEKYTQSFQAGASLGCGNSTTACPQRSAQPCVCLRLMSYLMTIPNHVPAEIFEQRTEPSLLGFSYIKKDLTSFVSPSMIATQTLSIFLLAPLILSTSTLPFKFHHGEYCPFCPVALNSQSTQVSGKCPPNHFGTNGLALTCHRRVSTRTSR